MFAAIVTGCNDTGPRTGYPPDIRALPLIELHASGRATDALVIMVTGDGGWANLVRSVGRHLARDGIPVIALSAPRYFLAPRTPAESAEALARIIQWFVDKTGHHRVLLVGYSRGADVLPFMVNRLPPELKALVDLTVLIGPEPTIAFQFHVTDWIPFLVPEGLPVLPEALKLGDLQVLCIYGMEESDSICPKLHSKSVTLAPFPGGHHFKGAYDRIGERVLEQWAIGARDRGRSVPTGAQ